MMTTISLTLILAAAVMHGARAAVPEDLVTSLPGWKGPLPSKHYSGYIPVGKTSGKPGMIHYWLILSENEPATDPLVYWTNGGPGGSGISTGLLTELGQLQLNDDSIDEEGNIHLLYNKFNWATNASTLFVSQPKGVGFSYCVGATSDADCHNDDKSSAEDAYDFFINFFERYPEFKSNPFYLTAESYGGIYIPTFMREIKNRGGIDNLKGAAIGDGCWGTEVGSCKFDSGKAAEINFEFFSGHGMIPQPLYTSAVDACKPFSDESVKSAACQKKISEMNSAIGSFDIYNIYDTCGSRNRDFLAHNELLLSTSKLGGAVNDYPCGGGKVSSEWLLIPEVAAALHVKSGTPGMQYTWGPSNYSGDLRPTYKELAQDYHMLIYSGDTDACIPYWGTEEWTRELGFDVATPWRAWKSRVAAGGLPQRAGYVIDYDPKSKKETNFRFQTVQGSGHMVPTYKPAFAHTMINDFIHGRNSNEN